MKPETRIQIDLVTWLRKNYPQLLFTSTQAGDRRGTLAAVMMKRMGYRNGTPDLIIFLGRHGYYGLLVELKTEDGKWSDGQIEFSQQAVDNGYKYMVCYGLDQAKRDIKEYIA